jgi:hypothetical protein
MTISIIFPSFSMTRQKQKALEMRRNAIENRYTILLLFRALSATHRCSKFAIASWAFGRLAAGSKYFRNPDSRATWDIQLCGGECACPGSSRLNIRYVRYSQQAEAVLEYVLRILGDWSCIAWVAICERQCGSSSWLGGTNGLNLKRADETCLGFAGWSTGLIVHMQACRRKKDEITNLKRFVSSGFAYIAWRSW